MRHSSAEASPWQRRGTQALGALFAAFVALHFYNALFGQFEPLVQRPIFIGFGLGGAFFLYAARAARTGGRNGLERTIDITLGLLAFGVCLYVILNRDRFSDIMVQYGPLDKAAGLLAVLLTLEAARRVIGWFLPLLALITVLYYYFGYDLIDGGWRPPRVSARTAVETFYSSTTGIFGYLADVGARVITIYVLLGALLLSTGATDVFMKMATWIAGRTFGGPAKVCALSSAMFGTVTGSAVANVMATGSITIPTMKRLRYPPAFAGAVEAVASSAGQLTPPVMGAGAFIMAEFLNIPYTQIAVAAMGPAFLYYLAIWLGVDLYARRTGLQPTPKNEMPKPADFLAPDKAIPLFLPIATVVYFLFQGYTPSFAGAASIIVLILACAAVRPFGRDTREQGLKACWTGLARDVYEGMVEAGRALVMIAALLACAAIVVKVLTATGAGVKISNLLFSVSDQGLIVALLLAAVLSIVLGMDVPTTASYVLAAAVAAPSLVRLGLPELTAHLFVFYYAILSAITPPVCASVYAAAALAGANFWKVAGRALVLAGAVYVVPFLFVFRPGILAQGGTGQIVLDLGVASAAVFAVSVGLSGYFRGTLSIPGRGVFLASAALLFYAAPMADIIGGLALTGLIVWRFMRGERQTLSTG
ncbi:TRAP transporter permease [Pseudosulfitobacter pseudonitzschiae]|jgi:TRAP transporter 4TM/12TM fusion protein|uniref:C4-dicarboxylate ABC transporter n=1 Tax=Pseudosulfitobacter pseudonitzschiae TaxID=1402135 RepID=A0A073IY55_9RHOB|nr:TRAP transporter fused permease subunit [Pseudosulfitobacter pseudonitzschiae]KEJ94396.1 C4-dicarboxylate ABC transporter [Pseudosulfitobacter pseudonitzschiae]MCA0137448.1 TRAP transporter fused permease subunit [Pseudosulfitobacter pseudonitzschiae]MCD2312396.1 TRAP transporter fused permease subunit [Pseudosulfitobacter pseudonitzschiae]MCD2329035.1 TRAP transporter fused permease subunit [Pseudosulfitobacter pseudonitzschiae]MCD2353460.1 TRAP transporter fused permease subunit [Pseudosu|tara:strand:- start:33 stop:1976 length:1944 start_codon:yes stop_codon:yes gene_type:complete